MAFEPVIIVGVPRSGTTLLRVLLDSHSQIAALPESPWLLGVYGTDVSLRSLMQTLIDHPFGVVKNVTGMAEADVHEAGRAFLARLFEPLLKRLGKNTFVLKTPDDIQYLEFLVRFLPRARYIHITRDGRDAALSQVVKKEEFFSDLREFGELTFSNALRRWVEWERHIRKVLRDSDVATIDLRYEDLVSEPEQQLSRVLTFLGLPFEAGALDYTSKVHDYPRWEAGSTDVARRQGISTDSIGGWKRAVPTRDMVYALQKYDRDVVALGYPPSNLPLSLPQRAMAAAAGLTQPVRRVSYIAKSSVRNAIRTHLSAVLATTATIAMAGLAADMVLPPTLLDHVGPDSLAVRLFLGAVAAVSIQGLFWPGRRPTKDDGNAKLPIYAAPTLLMVSYVSLLEGLQLALPYQHPQLAEFLSSLAIVVAAGIAGGLPVRWIGQRAKTG